METAIFVVIYLIVLTLAIGGLSAAPWLPTRRKQRERLMHHLPLEEGATVCDLGCGDGVVLFEFARRYPEVKAIGYEIALLPFVIGKMRKTLGGRKYRNVEIHYGNFFWERFPNPDLTFVFLFERCYPKVMKKLAEEVRDDSRVVVEAWRLPGVEPEQEIREEGLVPIYVYRGGDIKRAIKN